MRNLRTLRESGEALRREDTLIVRATPVQDSINQWLRLQSAFEWQLQQTAPLFEGDRRAALAELQARLQLLAD